MNDIRTSCRAMGKECGVLTVDSDGNGLRENEAVGALEGGDLAELVELQVLLRDTLGGLGGDELDIEAVLLGDGEERGGARVTLRGLSVAVVGCAALRCAACVEGMAAQAGEVGDSRCSCRSFRKT